MPTRRAFLSTAAGLAAGGSLVSRLTAIDAAEKEPAVAQTERRFPKAVKSGMVRGNESLTEKFTLLKELGYDGIDMSQRHPREEVLKAMEVSGLTVHGTVGYDHWSVPLSHPDLAERKKGLALYVECIRDAHAFGGTSALLVPAVVSKDVSYGDAYTRSQEMIREALPVAAELRIQILFENVWNNFLLSPVEMARYIDEFESDWVGSYFDVGNVVRYAWPTHWIAALGKRIKKLDVKEYSRTLQNEKGPRAGFGVEIGEGDCDWPDVVTALEAIDFRGWCTAEVAGGGRERLAEIKQRMDRVLPG